MRGIGVHYTVPIEPCVRLVNGFTLIISMKLKEDMEHYYNCFTPGDKVYLNASDIRTTYPSKKLAHK